MRCTESKAEKDQKVLLSKIRKLCKIFGVGFKIGGVFVLIWWIIAVFAMIASLLNPASFDYVGIARIASLAVFSLAYVVVAAFFVVISKLFSSLSKGSSPFSTMQAKRLRVLAILLVLYFVLVTAASFFSTQIQYDSLHSGFFVTGINANSFATVDPAPLLIAAIFFALSFVFEYGVLLQNEANETV